MRDNTISIYVLKHIATGKHYVGRSRNPEQRIANHFSALKRGCHPVEDMQKDFDNFGGEYKVAIVEKNARKEDEFKWMLFLDSLTKGKGYNYKDPMIKKDDGRQKTKQTIVHSLSQLNNDQLDLIEKLVLKLIEE